MRLAILNGERSVTIKPKQWPSYDDNEKAAIKEVLEARIWGTLGPNAMTFADEFAQYCGVKHAISINNGTVGLEIILKGLEIGYGDEVIIPPNTLFSTLSAVAAVGATPVFADINENFNIDPIDVLEKITVHTRAVIAFHMGGYPADIDTLKPICKKRGIYLIEDACGAQGSAINNKKVGSLADAAVFDFYMSDNMACGEGGCVTTDNYKTFKKVWEQHNSGRTYDDSSEFGGTVMCGTNARMAEFEGAVCRCQLKHLDSQIKTKNRAAKELAELLKGCDFISLPKTNEKLITDSYNSFILKYNSSRFNNIPRSKFINALQAEGVLVTEAKRPLYKSDMLQTDYFKKATGSVIDYNKIFLPKAELFSEQIMLLSGNSLLNGNEYIKQIAASFDKLSININQLK